MKVGCNFYITTLCKALYGENKNILNFSKLGVENFKNLLNTFFSVCLLFGPKQSSIWTING